MTNRTIFTGDNLDVLRGFNSGCVDLIYLDPPFNSRREYSAPVGSKAAGAAFRDTWHWDDVDAAWLGEVADAEPRVAAVVEAAGTVHGRGMKSYLLMMGVRLIELRRVLKPTGSIWLHCDPTANSYLRLLMDAVFGRAQMRREIVWTMPRPSGFKTQAKNWVRGHDTLLYYAGPGHKFNKQYEPYTAAYLRNFNRTDEKGRYWLRSGKKRRPGKGYHLSSAWTDLHSMQTQSVSRAEGVGYPTQKPLALLRRIIEACSDPGDVVLDPFCGCATTCVAAEELSRKWVGIDLSEKAFELVELRLRDHHGFFGDVVHRADLPRRTDVDKPPPYRTQKHVLYGRAEGNCHYCGIHFPFRNMTIDHRLPRSKGGTDHLDNLLLACGACNSAKGSMDYHTFKARTT